MLRQLPHFPRRILAVVIGGAGIGYLTIFVLAYLSLMSPSAAVPDIRELDRLLFGFRERRPGLIEQLLEATDGPLKRGGSMRPAFTDQSVGWGSLTQKMSAEEKAALIAEREGERLRVFVGERTNERLQQRSGELVRQRDQADVTVIEPQLRLDRLRLFFRESRKSLNANHCCSCKLQLAQKVKGEPLRREQDQSKSNLRN